MQPINPEKITGWTKEEMKVVMPDRVDARVDARLNVVDVRTRIENLRIKGAPNWEIEYWEDIESHL